jgi:penicillin amidase
MNQRHRVIVFFVAGLLLIAMLSATATLPLSAGGPETGQVTIIRDEYGVPHVFGSTPESLWYGVGYAQAQDRLWQADLLRRQAGGTSAEFFGPGALGGDIFSRTLFGSEQHRTDMFVSASAETQMVLNAFTDGMNAWIEEAATSG